MLALHEARKAAKLPTLNVRVSHRMAKEVFDAIGKLTSWGGAGDGGGKGKKKGGKKKVAPAPLLVLRPSPSLTHPTPGRRRFCGLAGQQEEEEVASVGGGPRSWGVPKVK